MTKTTDNDDADFLESILDYSKYLYEEENDRRDRLNNAVKVYLGFLTFILGVGVIKILSFKELSLLLNADHKVLSYFCFLLLGLSLTLLAVSFVFTILVLKMWPYERLCNPKTMLIKSVFLGKKKDYLSSVISDYVVACNRNYVINNSKSKLLSHALLMLIVGLIILAISLLLIKLLVVTQGGVA